MGSVEAFLKGWEPNAKLICCRICHEEEQESCKSLEAPCACSGTVQFAHRDCIQRWCYEKGNTTCEICLHKYEPGYTAPLIANKSQLIEAAVTIRDSLEIPRREYLPRNSRRLSLSEGVTDESDYSECSSVANRSASCCRSLALIVTILLLVRHMLVVLASKSWQHPLALVTILSLRACGIILPVYIIMRTIAAVHKTLPQRYPDSDDDSSYSVEVDDVDEDVEMQNHHIF